MAVDGFQLSAFERQVTTVGRLHGEKTLLGGGTVFLAECGSGGPALRSQQNRRRGQGRGRFDALGVITSSVAARNAPRKKAEGLLNADDAQVDPSNFLIHERTQSGIVAPCRRWTTAAVVGRGSGQPSGPCHKL